MTKTGHEKRIHPRRVLRTKMVIEDESGEGFLYFYTTDLSLGGVFLESDIPLNIGTQVLLSFSLKDGELPIRTLGKVVRVEKDPNDILPIIGMGIQFVNISQAAQKEIDHYILGSTK